MLNACSKRSKSKYQIMLNTGLNTATFNKYVDVIVKAELVSLIGIDSFFVTPKGMEYLRYHEIAESIMGSYL